MTDQGFRVRTIVGLEVHVQLKTATKLFCACPLAFEAPPNSRVCPVCLGHPGALPVIDREALDLAMLAGLALNCEVATFTKWDRKSYYYPDMPKNYQISQYDLPLCGPGHFDLPGHGDSRRIRIRRAHLEEDAGKNLHDTPGCTLVDLNRAGTPLLEIVTEPDIATADEAYAFCTELHKLVTYLGVSEGNMKKGQMRFEPNVNVAITVDGVEHRTPIAEIKNLNSFKAVRSAIAFETRRQTAAWEADPNYVVAKAPNENRGWNDDKGVTEYQRPKEAAHDYRYFPDPDLVPVTVTDEMLAAVRERLGELPIDRRARLTSEFGMSDEGAEIIVADRRTADLYEEAVRCGGPADLLATQFVNVWLKLARDRGLRVTELGVDAGRMALLARMVSEDTLSRSAAARVAGAMLDRPDAPDRLAMELGLVQVRDTETTDAWIEAAFVANDQAVQDAMANPKKRKAAAGFLRGQVMRLSGGKADPKLVAKLIEDRLTTMRGTD